MRIKDGAIIAGLDIVMRPVLINADAIWKAAGYPHGVTITSGLDGTHSAGSLHYYGRAVDLRIWKIDDNGNQVFPERRELIAMVDELRRRIGADYDVVPHRHSHVHVEYDPK
jgi:hypothetical protein